MRTILPPVAALLGPLIAAVALAQPAPNEAHVRYRVEIAAPANIAAALRQGLDLVRWESDPNVTVDQLRRLATQAERSAEEAAATEGYFSAHAQARIDESSDPWVVRLDVQEGERTLIGEVDLRFTGPATTDDEARDLLRRVRQTWTLQRGQPFRQADWDAAKRRAVRELSSWRYAAARIVESRARVNPAARRADLTVELESGPPYYFGEVQVAGTRRYASALAVNLRPFRTGDVYDRDLLGLYQRRLIESGYFVSAQADVLLDQGSPAAAPVRVGVIEASTHHFEAGIGYTTDAGPRLDATFSNQDSFGKAWRFRSGLELDRKIQSLDLNFDAPPRPGGRWNSFFARARDTDIQNQVTRELAAGVSHNLGAQIAPSAFIVSGHIEDLRISGSPPDNSSAVYFGYRHSFRRTDDYVSPRSGYVVSAEVGGAPPALATQGFFRAVGSASLFIPLARLDDLLLRGEAGRVFASSREGIPSSFLFRTGGDQTVRGYAFESLGVRQGDAIVGGRHYAVGTVEYTHWFAESWGIAAFVDAGNAWDDTAVIKAAIGYGIGPRFRTPIGPIRADLAYGQQTGEVRLHFSVGYRF